MRPVIRVLLVEDEEAESFHIKSLLANSEDAEFVVEHVYSLKSALQVLEMAEYDIALLDLSLPDAHGYDTVAEFARSTECPFIVLTGNSDITMAMRCASLGAQDFILKNEVRARSLERALLFASKRARTDQVRKDLDRASLAQVYGSEGKATVTLLRPQVSKLMETLEDLEGFIYKNAPGLRDDVESLLSKHGTRALVREIRDLLRVKTPSVHRAKTERPEQKVRPPRERSLSDAAFQAVGSITRKEKDSVPPDAATAEATLLDVITRRGTFDEG